MNGLTKECKKTTTPISASCEEDKLQRYVHVFVNLTRSHLFHELPSLVPTLHPYKWHLTWISRCLSAAEESRYWWMCNVLKYYELDRKNSQIASQTYILGRGVGGTRWFFFGVSAASRQRRETWRHNQNVRKLFFAMNH